MQYVNLILSSKIFFEKKSEFENQINLIKYAPMTEIQTILYPPLIHLTKKIRVNLKITNLDSGIKILSVESWSHFYAKENRELSIWVLWSIVYLMEILSAASVRLYQSDKIGRYGNEEVLKDLEN